jgi:hypothetical protein
LLWNGAADRWGLLPVVTIGWHGMVWTGTFDEAGLAALRTEPHWIGFDLFEDATPGPLCLGRRGRPTRADGWVARHANISTAAGAATSTEVG